MKILFLSPTVPFPLTDGGRIRVFNLLKQIAQKSDVTLLALETQPTDTEGIVQLQQLDVQAHLVPNASTLPRVSFGTLVTAFLKRQPLTVARYNLPAYRQKFRELVATETFDLVHYEMFHTAQFHTETRLPGVLSQQNVDSAIWRRLCSETVNPFYKYAFWTQQRAFQRYERVMTPKFDMVTCTSDIDAAVFQQHCAEYRRRHTPLKDNTPAKHGQIQLKDNTPAKHGQIPLKDNTPAKQGQIQLGCPLIEIIPNGVDVTHYQPNFAREAPAHLIYIGSMDWYPNEDAVSFFADEVLPKIHERIKAITPALRGHLPTPEVKFSIVGGNPSRRVQKLADRQGIVVTGRVADIKPYFEEATVFVVPLRIGSGTRLKILEALAMGKAIVSTSVGAEGLALRNGEEIFIADEPTAFADAVTRLLTDALLRRRIGENGRARVERDYDWRSIGAKLHTLYESLIKK